MAAISRTFTLLCVIVAWHCTFTTVQSRPLNPKKHTLSPFKHHRHTGTHSKNAIGHHPATKSLLHQEKLGIHKTSKTSIPFHFSPTQTKQQAGTVHHNKPAWDAISPGNHEDASPAGMSVGAFGGPVVEAPAITGAGQAAAGEQVAPKERGGFEIWGSKAGSYHPLMDAFPGAFQAPGSTIRDGEDTADRGQSAQQRRPPSKAIHMVPGLGPRVVEESFADGDLGTLLLSSSDQGTDSADGWFMSAPPFPEHAEPTHIEQSQSSSSGLLGDMWGAFMDKKN